MNRQSESHSSNNNLRANAHQGQRIHQAVIGYIRHRFFSSLFSWNNNVVVYELCWVVVAAAAAVDLQKKPAKIVIRNLHFDIALAPSLPR